MSSSVLIWPPSTSPSVLYELSCIVHECVQHFAGQSFQVFEYRFNDDFKIVKIKSKVVIICYLFLLPPDYKDNLFQQNISSTCSCKSMITFNTCIYDHSFWVLSHIFVKVCSLFFVCYKVRSERQNQKGIYIRKTVSAVNPPCKCFFDRLIVWPNRKNALTWFMFKAGGVIRPSVCCPTSFDTFLHLIAVLVWRLKSFNICYWT